MSDKIVELSFYSTPSSPEEREECERRIESKEERERSGRGRKRGGRERVERCVATSITFKAKNNGYKFPGSE